MIPGILGKKIGMTQIFDDEGSLIPVTAVETGPCVVTQVKKEANDGYNAIQLGFVNNNSSKINKSLKGHFDKSKVKPQKFLKEFRFDNSNNINLGDQVSVAQFNVGDFVNVTGYSKGIFDGKISLGNYGS